MTFTKRGILAASITALALAATTALAGCSAAGGSDEGGGGAAASETVRIGVVGASDPYWETFTAAAAEEGIEVELVDFTDYNQPNPALSEGELDLNQFQHIVYLADYNVANDDDLVAIGSTAIYPLGVFSTKHDSLEDIPEGGTVAIPSDPTNRARALNVLQAAELIELSDGGSLFSTPDDIDASASKVQVTEMDASFTATSLSDVDAAVVNNDFVTDAGLKFDEALYQDDPEDEGAKYFINIFAARAEDKDNETYQKLVEIYQTNQDVQDGVFENSGDSAILLNTPVSELQEILTDSEEQVRENK
ncbi:methionine ABC transporter substrate-binding protein [Leucobacter sp. UCD-THU]|jgi:D-methionine transport system substrate-binding protein|uniref:Methionine ABC transporter substrate-binding protein n=1 Tax=Leucobacter muris TaxID=1935379 RepID=A0ABX5QFE1_9MICO|nr:MULTISPECIES: MetQ/NlpA family ABC transporter substrate-binding protein [Leucobacter]EYT52538.1 methionine ABC transporter substrate-binding protein [Leucobacter sp. UCD-THU]QAB17804.1 methionine ABC transporter substrate-binding protein [Leucobacter muris]